MAKAGVGLNYVFTPKISFVAEADLGEYFFRDRYTETYLSSGVPDTTGMYYVAKLGMQVYF